MTELADRLSEQTTLTRRQAAVVAGRVEGQTYQTIADEMGVTRGTAHKHGKRARQKAQEAQQTVTVLEEIGFIED
jgi:DNA-directed RNA polymerase specialized sigma24 family protein